ncbi:hypothetical protein HK100_003502 [Physocladia obscura]|uniref:Uncharacterized protein n=1 Tax=Physocladia obscura TaxID=109957 RepID=A0AAD5XEJ3_9FUNG|nr:hypothetical protein HK100_003502 [Physocladia obscura]
MASNDFGECGGSDSNRSNFEYGSKDQSSDDEFKSAESVQCSEDSDNDDIAVSKLKYVDKQEGKSTMLTNFATEIGGMFKTSSDTLARSIIEAARIGAVPGTSTVSQDSLI